MVRSGRTAEWKKFAAAFSEQLGDVGEQLTSFAKIRLSDACQEWLDETDSEWPQHTEMENGAKFGGDHFHPWFYGHLHDSVAVRIADGNKTVAVHYMPASADMEHTQHATASEAGRSYDHIIGHEMAVQEARNAESVFLPGIQMQLIVGVPYARKVNESSRHSGYLDELRVQFFSHIEDTIEESIEPDFRNRVFKPKKK